MDEAGAVGSRRVPAGVSAVTSCLLALACSGSVPSSPEPAELDTAVRFDPEVRFQTLEGFGASLAWFADRVSESPDPELARLLFSDLGLDILRLRNRFQRSRAFDADLSADVEAVALATAALGRPPRILMTSWSPPAALKANRLEDCRGNADCTLARQNGTFVYEAFADYWHASLAHYAELGIVPEWVSIQNEPSFIPQGWEGCRFDPRETALYPGYDRALASVSARLASLDSPPRLLGPETLGIHWNAVQDYLGALDESLLAGVAHHLYERGGDGVWDWKQPGPDSFTDEMRAVARATSKPLYQTEFKTDEDGSIEGGFETAWLIHSSLVEEGVSAFLYWDLVWERGSGLVMMDDGAATVRDQYYSVRHFARYTEPGDQRIAARSNDREVKSTAFLAPDGGRAAIVLLNTADEAKPVTLDLGALTLGHSEIFLSVFEPGSSELWSSSGALPENNVISLPSRSVATIVLSERP